jgi:hypothetical protein
MMNRDESSREASDRLGQDEHHPYEPPTLTTLGSFSELTEATKTGGATDPGDGFQPSNAF